LLCAVDIGVVSDQTGSLNFERGTKVFAQVEAMTVRRVCRFVLLTVVSLVLAGSSFAAGIERIWLSHRSNDPSQLVVNWETERPGNSVVRFGATGREVQTVAVEENVTLHHVEIPLAQRDATYHYTVATGQERSAEATLKAYPTETLRVAVVADWQAQPKLDAVARDDVHLLLTAGDNIDCLHRLCGAGVKDCTKPYSRLVANYPELFRTTPFMPILGNHDREIRPRGSRPPAEPVYDIEATSFRKFFELPDDEWKWHLDIPEFAVRLVALDLNHISDRGTTWQTCHPFDKSSAQYQWYDRMTGTGKAGFLVTLYNERNANMRAQEGGAWHQMFRRGTIAITGFGYYAERAEVDGFPYYNTSLGGKGDRYPDPQSKFFESADNYILLTFTRSPRTMTVALKGLDGTTLDQKVYRPAP
jgi:hypothetical protein